MMATDFIGLLISLCCSSLCCVLVLVAIIAGVVFLLKRSKSGETGSESVDSLADVVADEPSAPEEETQPVDSEAVTTGVAEQTDSNLNEPSSSQEAAPDSAEPSQHVKAAGQTIIAFDDDDEDF